MKTNKKVIALIMVLSLIFCNTIAFAEMDLVKVTMPIIAQEAYNVSTNQTFKVTDLTSDKYNFLVYGGTDCSNTYATLQALDKFIAITKPGVLQAFYFDVKKKSNQEVLDLGKKANLKNIILCSDPDNSKKYSSTAWQYFGKLNKTKETSYTMPVVVLTNKKGEIKYYSTNTQKEGSLFEALSQVANGDDIFISQYVNYGVKVEENNIKLHNNQDISPDAVSAYLKESDRINPNSESLKKLANELTANISGTSEHSAEYLKLKAIYTWVAKNIYYDRLCFEGYFKDTTITAEDVSVSKYSVCEGYANLLAALCRSANIPCKAVVGYAIGSAYNAIWTEANVSGTQTNHKWNEAFVDGRWIMLDVTWDSPNTFLDKKRLFQEFYKGQYGEGVSEWNVDGEVTYEYFDCSVEKMSELHKIVKFETIALPTPIPTATPIPTPTVKPIATPTIKPTSAPIAIPTPAVIPTAAPTAIPTPTVTPTANVKAKNTGVFLGKYGKAQVFDVRRTPAYPVANSKFQLSNFIAPLDAAVNRNTKINWGNDGDCYITIEYKGYYNDLNIPSIMKSAKENYAKDSNPPVVGLKLFSKEGTFIKDISNIGFVWGISDDGFLFTAYDNSDDLGYFFSNNQGYKYGNALTTTPKTGLVSELSVLENYDATKNVLKEAEVKTTSSFVDLGGVASSWAVPEVEAAKKGNLVIQEITDNYQKNITREEFCKLVVKLYEKIGGEIPVVGASKFKDTSTNEVIIANKLGIVNGVSDVEFAPNADITREQIAAMMKRMIEINFDTKSDNNLSKYSDYNAISSWALDSLTYLNGLDIIKGVSDKEIAPKQNTTREQAILISYRIFKILSKK